MDIKSSALGRQPYIKSHTCAILRLSVFIQAFGFCNRLISGLLHLFATIFGHPFSLFLLPYFYFSEFNFVKVGLISCFEMQFYWLCSKSSQGFARRSQVFLKSLDTLHLLWCIDCKELSFEGRGHVPWGRCLHFNPTRRPWVWDVYKGELSQL